MGRKLINTLQEFEEALRKRSFAGHTQSGFAGLVYGVLERLQQNGAPPGKINDILVAAGVKGKGSFKRYVDKGRALCRDVYAFDRIMDEDLEFPATPPGGRPVSKTAPAEEGKARPKEAAPKEAPKRSLPGSYFGDQEYRPEDGIVEQQPVFRDDPPKRAPVPEAPAAVTGWNDVDDEYTEGEKEIIRSVQEMNRPSTPKLVLRKAKTLEEMGIPIKRKNE